MRDMFTRKTISDIVKEYVLATDKGSYNIRRILLSITHAFIIGTQEAERQRVIAIITKYKGEYKDDQITVDVLNCIVEDITKMSYVQD